MKSQNCRQLRKACSTSTRNPWRGTSVAGSGTVTAGTTAAPASSRHQSGETSSRRARQRGAPLAPPIWSQAALASCACVGMDHLP